MVVVVVVYAMPVRQGDLVGVKKHYVFRHTDRADHNVVTTITVGELDLDGGETYLVEIQNSGGRGGNETIVTAEMNVSEDGQSLTIPYEVVRDSNKIVPGQTVNIKVYERVEVPEQISDSADILGRAEVVGDPSVRDNCDARLTCESASEYLGNDRKTIRFRNVRTKEEYEVETHSNYDKKTNAVSFPIIVREAISAEPADLIELIKPAQAASESEDAAEDKDVEELIREMHGMMMEMYNDYLEHKND
jgi:hypothetical protein